MDYDIYTTEMSKSVWDKAFFMDKIPGVKCVIDFGCADGAMIRYLSPLFPDIMFVGYDISNELLNRARKTPPFNANIIYFEDGPLAGVAALTRYVLNSFKPEEICINFSSVLHEVFSSTGGDTVIKYLVTRLHPKFITIRDMYCDDPVNFIDGGSEVVPILDMMVHNYGARMADKFNEYSKKHGALTDWRDFTQFLMKVQWVDNGWADEMKEDYFSWTLDKLYPVIGAYSPCFEARYQLPYLSEKWKKEYGWYNPDIHTHAQFILRRDN